MLMPLTGPPPPPRTRTGSERVRRLVGVIVAGGGGSLLGVAARLDPSPDGLGTHEQLNLPTCGWISLMDVPCPTCGMTTAFAHAADGHLLTGFAAHPLGLVLAIATAMALLIGLYVAATGSRVGAVLGRLWGPRTGWLLAALVLASWAYKVVSYTGVLGGLTGVSTS